MSVIGDLKILIDNYITTNGAGEITGAILNTVLNTMSEDLYYSGLTFSGGTVSYVDATYVSAVTFYGDGSNLTGIVGVDAYTKAESDANFLSATTSFYTELQADANFLSANTSFYTEAQADANFLSGNTSFYTELQADANFLSGNTFTVDEKNAITGANSPSASNVFATVADIVASSTGLTKIEADTYYLSLSGGTLTGDLTAVTYYGDGSQLTGVVTDAYTTAQADANFLSGNTFIPSDFYSRDQADANFLSANTSYYTELQADANFLSANTSYYTQTEIANLNGELIHYHNISTINTFFYNKTEVDGFLDLKLDLTGGVLTGNLTGTTFSGDTYYGDGSNLTGVVASGTYTKAESDANYLSANTSYYTELQADANFLSANTSYYTESQADANFLSANTSYYTELQADANFLSANTSYYTQAEVDGNFLSANTSYYTQAEVDGNFLSANTSYYTESQADANFLSARTYEQIDLQLEWATGQTFELVPNAFYGFDIISIYLKSDANSFVVTLSGDTTAVGGMISISGNTSGVIYDASSDNTIAENSTVTLDVISGDAHWVYASIKLQR